jgi:hypothetical protein
MFSNATVYGFVVTPKIPLARKEAFLFKKNFFKGL